ncbi:MAG: endonuclease/exonuclease/phosphatase family protein [Spirosomataceae bacterium]
MALIIKFIRRISFLLNILLALYSLLVYQLSYSANIRHWLGGFLMLSAPLTFVFNGIFIVIWAMAKSRKVWLSVAVLLVATPLILRSFTWHFNEKSEENLSVMSYNLMWCDAFEFIDKSNPENGTKLTNLAVDTPSDIKCFQELYNNSDYEQMSLIKSLRKNNPHYTYIHSTPNNKNGQGLIGLAIFSKYPIIDKEEKYWQLNHNGLLSADIVVNDDTIRVINVQLKSMGIRVSKVLDNAKSDQEKAKKEAKTIYHQLKDGFESRTEQVKDLEDWIKKSPHPIILCGDLNELPYGYVYGRIRKYLANSFETAGRGFGFTYNKSPSFIRIDNQFYDEKRIEVKYFETFNNDAYSDHYAIRGEYKIK